MDNLLERLVPHKIPLIRLGHPARVLNELQGATLDAQAEASDEAALAKDVKKEIEGVMGQLTRNGKKGRVKGAERKKMWEEVRELKKECVFRTIHVFWTFDIPLDRYRKREGTVVKTIVSDAKVSTLSALLFAHHYYMNLTDCSGDMPRGGRAPTRRSSI